MTQTFPLARRKQENFEHSFELTVYVCHKYMTQKAPVVQTPGLILPQPSEQRSQLQNTCHPAAVLHYRDGYRHNVCAERSGSM